MKNFQEEFYRYEKRHYLLMGIAIGAMIGIVFSAIGLYTTGILTL